MICGCRKGDVDNSRHRGSTPARPSVPCGRMETMPVKQKCPARGLAGHFYIECRRRPTLPHPDECSTIGAGGLSFRVRDGTGRSPSANTTDNTIHLSPHNTRGVTEHTTPTPPHTGTAQKLVVCSGSHSGCEQQKCCGQALGLLVPVDSTPHRASIPGLSTPWSLGGLNHARWWETSSWNELPA